MTFLIPTCVGILWSSLGGVGKWQKISSPLQTTHKFSLVSSCWTPPLWGWHLAKYPPTLAVRYHCGILHSLLSGLRILRYIIWCFRWQVNGIYLVGWSTYSAWFGYDTFACVSLWCFQLLVKWFHLDWHPVQNPNVEKWVLWRMSFCNVRVDDVSCCSLVFLCLVGSFHPGGSLCVRMFRLCASCALPFTCRLFVGCFSCLVSCFVHLPYLWVWTYKTDGIWTTCQQVIDLQRHHCLNLEVCQTQFFGSLHLRSVRSRLFSPGFAALNQRKSESMGEVFDSTTLDLPIAVPHVETSLGLQQLTTRISNSHCQTMEQAYQQAKALQMDKWCKLVRAAGKHSSLFVDSSISRFRDAHIQFSMLRNRLLLRHLRSIYTFGMYGRNIVGHYKLILLCQSLQSLLIFFMRIAKALWGQQSICGKGLARSAGMLAFHNYWIVFMLLW